MDIHMQELVDTLEEHTAAWNSHDLDRLMNLYADHCIFESSAGTEQWGTRFVGREAVRTAFAEVLESMPDAHWGNGAHRPISEDYGVSEWTLTGTLADGSRIEVDGCDFLTVHGGKITHKNAFRKQRPPIEVSRAAL